LSQKSDSFYQLENVPIFEAVYGRGLISLGGYAAVKRMFEGLALANKHLLDVGFGLGGMSFYLAQTFGARVTGLEIEEWMTAYAKEKAPFAVRHQLAFIAYAADGSIPLPPASVDICYSKGVLTNISNKKDLFTEIFRVLKPGGQICFIDWLVPENIGPKAEMLPTGEASYKETEGTYRSFLKECGFQGVEFLKVNEEYLGYLKDLSRLLSSEVHKEDFKDVLKPDLRQMVIQSNLKLMLSVENEEQMSMRIRAAKPQ
jgi:ubiquinone/menaquinone biosynthesis C-methylase UbiE